MPLIACSNLQYSIGTRVLIDGLSFSIEAGERVGLVGRNGCGKTTWMRMLAGRLKPDMGTVTIQKGARIGYLTQDPELNFEATLREEAATGLTELNRLHAELDEVYEQMALPENAEGDALDRLLKRQSEVQHRIEDMGGYAFEHRIDQVLHGLGFIDSQFGVRVGALSGGQRGRLALAKLLLEAPELLLLDEPTNHLDIAGCEWLEDFLNNEFKGAVLMISHDRRMLDNVVHRIEEVEQGRLIDYPGNYTAFVDIRKQRLLTQHRAYENQQSQWAKEEEFIRRFKAGQRAKEAQGRLSKLERQKEQFALERPMEMAAMRMRLPEAPRSGDQVVVVREADKAYEAKDPDGGPAKTKVLFRNLSVTISRGDRWAIIGPNGAGKTTLVRAMLGQIPLDTGNAKLGSSVVIGYYEQLPPETDADTKVYQYLQHVIRKENPGTQWSEQQARDLAGVFLFSGADQEKRLGDLSGGERSRARLAGLLASAKNLIILDEPTNHLDIPSCERLEEALRSSGEHEDIEGYTGTLILISHDRYLIDAICDHLIVMDGEGNAEVFVGSYKEYHRKKLERAAGGGKDTAVGFKPASQVVHNPTNKPAQKPAQKPQNKAPQKTSSSGAKASAGVQDTGNGAGSKSSAATNGQGSKSQASKVQTKSAFSWMPADRLEKEIEKATKTLKAADDDLAKEEVYRDAGRFKKTLEARDKVATELAQLEEEWLKRSE